MGPHYYSGQPVAPVDVTDPNTGSAGMMSPHVTWAWQLTGRSKVDWVGWHSPYEGPSLANQKSRKLGVFGYNKINNNIQMLSFSFI